MITPSPFPRGSEWRIWDLHVHSPASSGFKGTYEELIVTTSNCEAAIIGINDYATLDGYLEILKKGGIPGRILLPVVELRMHNIIANRKSAQAGTLINFHLVFNNDSKVLGRAVNFVKSLKCYNSKGENDQLGNIPPNDLLKVTFDIDAVINSLTEYNLRDETLIWLPYDEYGGIDDIDPEDNFFKLNLIRKADIIGSSNPKQIDFFLWNDEKFEIDKYKSWFEKRKPCVKGSDAHDSTYPIGRLKDRNSQPMKRHCWIKADPTFEGLKQIVYEPENRVFIGETPPKLDLVRKAPEQFIDTLKILTESDDGEWFDAVDELELNTDLVSIIGNKGNGKSALADIISCGGNSNNTSFSFLKSGKFFDLGVHNKYKAVLTFRNASVYEKSFGAPNFDSAQPSKVVYLSQSFVEDLCEADDTAMLQQEIDRVVYSHIPREECQDSDKLADVILLKTGHFDDQIREKREKIHAVNEKIIEYQEYQKPQFRERMLNGLKDKENELKLTQINEKPAEVKKSDKVENAEIAKKLELLKSEQKKFAEQTISNQNELNFLVSDKIELTRAENSLKDLAVRSDELTKALTNNVTLQKYKIQSYSLLTFQVTTDPLRKAFDQADVSMRRIREQKINAESKVNEIDMQMKELTKSLSEKERAYESYLGLMEHWESKQKAIEGNRDEPNTIGWFNAWIEFLDKRLVTQLESVEAERAQLAKDIVMLMYDRCDALKGVYNYAEEYAEGKADEFDIPYSEFIEFDSSLRVSNEFSNRFLDFVNQNRKGTFYGTEEGRATLGSLLGGFDPEDEHDLMNLPNTLIWALRHNLAADPKGDNPQFDSDLDSQVASKIELYDYLFSFSYLDANFEITYAGKRIRNLSPGERGTLLLIFYLLIDKDLRPIIIDQPDENLDNETVYTRLVPFFRKAKNERQILIVTHNPNLAVVCDSEQIIHCSIDKENANLVRYPTGSIEYSEIRGKVIDVLEGTEPAFKNRQDKYEIE
jgi:ABC-type lipoprotein export system ATPase subunit